MTLRLNSSDLSALRTPGSFYEFFRKLNYNVESEFGAKPAVFDLQEKYFEPGQKIYTIVNYKKLFQVFLVEVKLLNRDTITNLSRQIGRHCPFPLIIFTQDYSNFVFTFLETVEEDGYKQKLIRLTLDPQNVYHTDLLILSSCVLEEPTTHPRQVFKQLRDAFSVERVTDQFFEEYRALFEELLESLTKNPWFMRLPEVSRKIITPENFAKKLLGQIVFLYFIQKKGWLGVMEGSDWGTGDKRFLKHLFDQCVQEEKNFFDDCLEPLFYDTLNNSERGTSDPSYSSYFHCRIPFLNGGLFEPEYDWKGTSIDLSNETFANIFSVFEKYNFTVKEDEPLDREVAVDPEMLGKIFENLLEENLRNNNATFYTPREIVHYMCQEALVRHLEVETGIDDNVLRSFLKREYRTDTKHESLPEPIRNNAKRIDELLQTVHIVDPAVGSGAFPVGMLHEIVSARMALNGELKRNPSEYKIKRDTIERCIYGVDIDPGAVEIAKLRLWLTLVVDHELKDIEPLPNLDYKIMVGNSLFQEVHGINLFNGEVDEQNHAQLILTGEIELHQAVDDFVEMKSKLFNAKNTKEKQKLRRDIHRLETQIVDLLLEGKRQHKIALRGSKEYLLMTELDMQIASIEQEEKKNGLKSSDYFLWKLHFAEVFKEKKGFDIVIANPPYDVYEGHKVDEIPRLKKLPLFDIAKGGKLNAYKLFLARSTELQKPRGVLCEIFQNSFLGDRSAVNVRKYFLSSQRILRIDSFPERDDVKRRVFESVKMSVCVMSAINEKKEDYEIELFIWHDRDMTKSKSVRLLKSEIPKFDNENFAIPSVSDEELQVLRKMAAYPKLKSIAHCYQGEVNLTTHKNYLSKDPRKKIPVLKGAAIQKWCFVQKMKQGEVEYLDANAFLRDNSGERSLHHKASRIVMQGITGVDERFRLKTTILKSGVFCAHSVNYIVVTNPEIEQKYLVGLLNSELLNWFFKIFNTNSNVNGYEIHNLPICNVSKQQRKKIEDLVSIIFELTKNTDKFIGSKEILNKVQDAELQLNKAVYELYDLSSREIAIIERHLAASI